MLLVPVLHCPECGSKLDIFKGGPIWTVRCRECNQEISIDGRKNDLFDAYDAYVKALSEGTLLASSGRISRKGRKPSKRIRTKYSGDRVQSEDQIGKLVQDGGLALADLPDSLQDILRTGRDYLVSYRFMEETDALYGTAVEDIKISQRLKELLSEKGINKLYRFQERAFRKISDGCNVVISAPTAQGKTEAFVLPIIKQLLLSIQDAMFNPGVRALLMYPTKALARDQYDKIKEMCEASGLSAAIFDGDVSQHERRKIYERPPDILLTNPDVLHYHLGWNRSRLVPLLRSVKYVVLDEIHLYTGSMGSNIYYILKRLQIECGAFQKIGASATISNPKEFGDLIFDSEVELIESESAKRGPIHFMMYYPGDRSKYSMIVDLVQMLYQADFQTLVFGNTHSEAEVLNMLLRDTGVKSMVHRAGLSKKYRNEVEEQFRQGDLQVLVSTPTLELGIDIGDLDCVVSIIVSITRLTQRIGRAGRKGQESVAVLALRDNDPISSFYRNKPEKFFTDIDAAYMEPDNEVVARYQLIAAAMTGKMTTQMFPRQEKVLQSLVDEGILRVTDREKVQVADYETARKQWRSYSIRGIGDTVEIRLKRKKLGERSMPMAAQELHPGAIYLHGGSNYLCVDFKYRKGLGKADVVSLGNRSAYTKPLYSTMPKIIEIHEERNVLGAKLSYCTLEMTQTVHGYVKKETRTGKILSHHTLGEAIVYKYKTRGFVFKAPEPKKSINDYLQGKMKHEPGPELTPIELYGGAFHALEHVVIESSDMLTGGGTREIGGVSMGDSGIIFVYDGSPGGNGASKLLFGRFEEALERAKTILEKCECKKIDGCPLCTYSYQCGNNNSPLFRFGALESVELLLKHAETKADLENYQGYQPLV